VAGRNLFSEGVIQPPSEADEGRVLFTDAPAGEPTVTPTAQIDDAQEQLTQELPEAQAITEEDGLGEALLSVGTSVLAEPIAGISGLVMSAFDGAKSGAETVELVREALTFDPQSVAGKARLKSIGEMVEKGVNIARIPVSGIAGLTTLATTGDIGEAAETVEEVQTRGISPVLGEATLNATGSPELAAVAHSLPTAALEAFGVKGLNKGKLKTQRLSGNVAEAITQAAPDLQTIRQVSSDAYKALDNSGVKIKPEVFDRFVDKLQKKVTKEGIDRTLTPKSQAVIDRFIDDKGAPKSPSQLETLRKIARGAANDLDKTDARIGGIIIDELDTAIDGLSIQIGGKFKEARGLAQRGFKSQAITDMIENASHTASGLENGLRIEARKLLKNKKRLKGFTSDEITTLKKIEQGTTAANTAKFLGKFGISEGQAASMLGASVGAGGGGAIGSIFGGPIGAGIGAVTVPAIGQIAKKTAQKITLNNTKFADDLARAGKNAKRVTRAYLKHTPIKNRRISDLTDLLLDQNLDPADIAALAKSKGTANKFVADAAFFAEEIKRRAQQAASGAVIVSPSVTREEQEQ